jgi:hypothetical protein
MSTREIVDALMPIIKNLESEHAYLLAEHTCDELEFHRHDFEHAVTDSVRRLLDLADNCGIYNIADTVAELRQRG